jgi:hypothetical protein
MAGGRGHNWTDEEDDTFVGLLIDYVNGCSIVRGSVHSQCWVEICNIMNGMTARQWTVGPLSSKYNRLRTDQREFSELLNDQTGFGWDPVTNTISGSATQ